MRPSCRCSSMALTTRPNSHPTNFILSKSTASFPWCLSLAVKFNEVDYELSRWATKMGQRREKIFVIYPICAPAHKVSQVLTSKSSNSALSTPGKIGRPRYPFRPDRDSPARLKSVSPECAHSLAPASLPIPVQKPSRDCDSGTWKYSSARQPW